VEQRTPTLFIGNRTLSNAQKLAKWIAEGTTRDCTIKAFHLLEEGISEEMKLFLNRETSFSIACPARRHPRWPRFAKEYDMHYANLTEYVAETDHIKALAKDASTGFVLQTGLAPGYIDVLAHHLFQTFCTEFQVTKVDTLEFKVGALTKNAVAPHFYGFTWSPVGVATEYIKEAEVIRDFKKTKRPSLSERATIIIDGTPYEADLTSGGAADLPDAMAGKVASMDYKTLRFPGHYAWVEEQIKKGTGSEKPIEALQEIMESQIPHIEEDQIILYAAVQGKDARGTLQRREVSKQILPQKVGKYTLRGIQTTTAAPLIQAAQLLLETVKGVILQSQIEPSSFLNGNFIVPVYGEL
jgi:saccharopine dehydrogenase-like NADP-dependent oxidoreductase